MEQRETSSSHDDPHHPVPTDNASDAKLEVEDVETFVALLQDPEDLPDGGLKACIILCGVCTRSTSRILANFLNGRGVLCNVCLLGGRTGIALTDFNQVRLRELVGCMRDSTS
jgi:hypothetical protein